MSLTKAAYYGCSIFDGFQTHEESALLVENGKIQGVSKVNKIPDDYLKTALEAGVICAGFVDLQVNGGGGVLLNDEPAAATMQTICDAHLPFGTTSLLPTLITDSPQQSVAAIAAAHEAIEKNMLGILGLHLEGPYLSFARRGTHEGTLIRKLEPDNVEQLVTAAKTLPSLMLTIAPEAVSTGQIAELKKAGAVISLGHSNATYAEACVAVEQGASSVTHLFNGMSQLTNREPGLVGCALQSASVSAGLIADGYHVDPVTMQIALRAKQPPGKIYLVTDAMSTVGSDLSGFWLNNRWIQRSEGRLTLEDGTLAGADLDMISAIKFIVNQVGVSKEEAIRMASLYPAQLLNRDKELGCLIKGARADFLRLSNGLDISAVWRNGVRLL
jgi:N-acetylglucosamine-6-phosphate deacetylase